MGHHFKIVDDERVFFSDKYRVIYRATGVEVNDVLVLNMRKERVVPAGIEAAKAYNAHDTEYSGDIVERLWELHPGPMEDLYGKRDDH